MNQIFLKTLNEILSKKKLVFIDREDKIREINDIKIFVEDEGIIFYETKK